MRFLEAGGQKTSIAVAIRFLDPTLRMFYKVTLHIAQDLYGSSIAFAIRSFDHSLFTRLILWSAEIWIYRILLTLKISMGALSHSLSAHLIARYSLA